MSQDVGRAHTLLSLVQEVPTLTWGRDEIARSDHDMEAVPPPEHGQASGWCAGLVLAGLTVRD